MHERVKANKVYPHPQKCTIIYINIYKLLERLAYLLKESKCPSHDRSQGASGLTVFCSKIACWLMAMSFSIWGKKDMESGAAKGREISVWRPSSGQFRSTQYHRFLCNQLMYKQCSGIFGPFMARRSMLCGKKLHLLGKCMHATTWKTEEYIWLLYT